MDGNVAGVGKLGFTLRVPIGVVGAISPFNFPLNLVSHKVAPAIAAGCPVVLKPASQTPLTALLLAEILLDECGLPPGWLNVVTGGGGTVGNALVDHPDVAMITFTGSPEVGWGIKGRAPRKKVGLELGNNAPVIVEPDADLELAAAKIVAGGYAYSGQTCIAVQRVYVHHSVRDELVEQVVPKRRGAERRRSARRRDGRVGADRAVGARPHRRLDRGGDRRRREGRDRRRGARRRCSPRPSSSTSPRT